MKIIIYILASWSIGMLSCSSGQNSISQNAINSDTIKKYIPEWRKDKSSVQIKNRIENLIGIENLEMGYKDQQIRVWFANSSHHEQLLIFKKTNKAWSGEINLLKFVYGTASKDTSYFNKDALISIERKAKEIHPESGWENLYDSLVRLDIQSLPDMEEIPGYDVGTDGRWVTIEIGTIDSYRIYSYFEPAHYANKHWQANRIEKIVKLIEGEFGFKSLVH